MKKILISLLMLTISIVGFANLPEKNPSNDEPKGIEFFNGSWDEALALAKAENKPIFLDISTAWCGYCKRMKAKTYTDTNVGAHYNNNFINVSVDAEKGEGIELKKKYGVTGYPSFVFLNSDGSLATKTSGYRSAEDFLKLANSISFNK
ncbi:MAG: thioredoxin family protein [Bacteroidetes bacterium]|nr:thioredoxin family protein [Bacteroidota bacterium]